MQPRIAHASSLPSTSVEIVVGRLLKQAKGPLPEFLARRVTSVHALVSETRPTRAEWCDAIAFLTEVVHASDELRQEGLMMSDHLSVTGVVDEIIYSLPRRASPESLCSAFL